MEYCPAEAASILCTAGAKCTHGGSPAISNSDKIPQHGEEGIRPIAINAVTRAGKTLQPDQIRSDRRCDILHIRDRCYRIIIFTKRSAAAIDSITVYLPRINQFHFSDSTDLIF
jgi:hypothetical protein